MFSYILKILILIVVAAVDINFYVKDPPFRTIYIGAFIVLVILTYSQFKNLIIMRRIWKNHSALPENGIASLIDENGNEVQCQIIGTTIYGGLEYAICYSKERNFNYVVDVRIFQGEEIWPNDNTIQAVMNKFLAENPNLR